MRFILTILILFHTSFAYCQKEGKVEGAWKVVGFGDEDLFFDLANDSILTSHGLEAGRGLMDSLQQPLLDGVPASQFLFQKDGRFVQRSGAKIDGKGTYRVDSKQQVVRLLGKRNNVPIDETLKYRFRGSFLYLTEVSEDSNFTYKLERLK